MQTIDYEFEQARERSRQNNALANKFMQGNAAASAPASQQPAQQMSSKTIPYATPDLPAVVPQPVMKKAASSNVSEIPDLPDISAAAPALRGNDIENGNLPPLPDISNLLTPDLNNLPEVDINNVYGSNTQPVQQPEQNVQYNETGSPALKGNVKEIGIAEPKETFRQKWDNFRAKAGRALLPKSIENALWGTIEDEEFLKSHNNENTPDYQDIDRMLKTREIDRERAQELIKTRSKLNNLTYDKNYRDWRNKEYGKEAVLLGSGLIPIPLAGGIIKGAAGLAGNAAKAAKAAKIAKNLTKAQKAKYAKYIEQKAAKEGVEAAEAAAKNNLVKTGAYIADGALQGAGFGALDYGVDNVFEREPWDWGELAKRMGQGGAIGAGFGGAIGGAGAAIGKAANSKLGKAASENIGKYIDSRPAVGNALGTIARILNTDVLHPAANKYKNLDEKLAKYVSNPSYQFDRETIEMIEKAKGLTPEEQEIVFKILRGEINAGKDLRGWVKEKLGLTNNKEVVENLTEQGFTPQEISEMLENKVSRAGAATAPVETAKVPQNELPNVQQNTETNEELLRRVKEQTAKEAEGNKEKEVILGAPLTKDEEAYYAQLYSEPQGNPNAGEPLSHVKNETGNNTLPQQKTPHNEPPIVPQNVNKPQAPVNSVSRAGGINTNAQTAAGGASPEEIEALREYWKQIDKTPEQLEREQSQGQQLGLFDKQPPKELPKPAPNTAATPDTAARQANYNRQRSRGAAKAASVNTPWYYVPPSGVYKLPYAIKDAPTAPANASTEGYTVTDLPLGTAEGAEWAGVTRGSRKNKAEVNPEGYNYVYDSQGNMIEDVKALREDTSGHGYIPLDKYDESKGLYSKGQYSKDLYSKGKYEAGDRAADILGAGDVNVRDYSKLGLARETADMLNDESNALAVSFVDAMTGKNKNKTQALIDYMPDKQSAVNLMKKLSDIADSEFGRTNEFQDAYNRALEYIDKRGLFKRAKKKKTEKTVPAELSREGLAVVNRIFDNAFGKQYFKDGRVNPKYQTHYLFSNLIKKKGEPLWAIQQMLVDPKNMGKTKELLEGLMSQPKTPEIEAALKTLYKYGQTKGKHVKNPYDYITYIDKLNEQTGNRYKFRGDVNAYNQRAEIAKRAKVKAAAEAEKVVITEPEIRIMNKDVDESMLGETAKAHRQYVVATITSESALAGVEETTPLMFAIDGVVNKEAELQSAMFNSILHQMGDYNITVIDKKAMGTLTGATHEETGEILVRSDLRGKDLAGTVAHEITHKLFKDIKPGAKEAKLLKYYNLPENYMELNKKASGAFRAFNKAHPNLNAIIAKRNAGKVLNAEEQAIYDEGKKLFDSYKNTPYERLSRTVEAIVKKRYNRSSAISYSKVRNLEQINKDIEHEKQRRQGWYQYFGDEARAKRESEQQRGERRHGLVEQDVRGQSGGENYEGVERESGAGRKNDAGGRKGRKPLHRAEQNALGSKGTGTPGSVPGGEDRAPVPLLVDELPKGYDKLPEAGISNIFKGLINDKGELVLSEKKRTWSDKRRRAQQGKQIQKYLEEHSRELPDGKYSDGQTRGIPLVDGAYFHEFEDIFEEGTPDFAKKAGSKNIENYLKDYAAAKPAAAGKPKSGKEISKEAFEHLKELKAKAKKGLSEPAESVKDFLVKSSNETEYLNIKRGLIDYEQTENVISKQGGGVYLAGGGKGGSDIIDPLRDYSAGRRNKKGTFGERIKDKTGNADSLERQVYNSAIRNVRVKTTDDILTYVEKNIAKELPADGVVEKHYTAVNSTLLANAMFNKFSREWYETVAAGETAIKNAFKDEKVREGWLELAKRAGGNDYQIPTAVYNKLFDGSGETAREYMERYGNISTTHKIRAYSKKIGAVIDAVNNLWKRGKLNTISFFVNNRANQLMLMAASKNPVEYLRSIIDAGKYKNLPNEIKSSLVVEAFEDFTKRKTYTGYDSIDNFYNLLNGHEVNTSNLKTKYALFAEGLNIILAKPNALSMSKISKPLMDLNQKFETFERQQAYALAANRVRKDLVKKTGRRMAAQKELIKEIESTPELEEAVIKSIEDTLGDYNKFSTFERKILKRVFPFYSWYRAIARHTQHLIEVNPTRVALIWLELERMANKDTDVKDWQRGNFPIPDYIPLPQEDTRSWKKLRIGKYHQLPWNSAPQKTAMDLASGILSGKLQDRYGGSESSNKLGSIMGDAFAGFMGATSPLIQYPLQAARGKMFFNDNEITNRRYTKAPDWVGHGYFDNKTGTFKKGTLPVSTRLGYLNKEFSKLMAPEYLNGIFNIEPLIQAAVHWKQTGRFLEPDKLYDADFGGYYDGEHFGNIAQPSQYSDKIEVKPVKRYAFNNLSERTKVLNRLMGTTLQNESSLTPKQLKARKQIKNDHKIYDNALRKYWRMLIGLED